MDGSYSKRAVHEVSGLKKKPAPVVKDTTATRDGTGQLCNRIGCCGRLNHDTVGIRYKSLEKSKPLTPSFRSTSGKNFRGGSSKNSSKSSESLAKKVCSTTDSRSVPRGIEIQELGGASGSHANKSNSESNNGRRKRLTQGESSSSGKGKMIIGVPTNEARISNPKTSRNVNSSRASGVSSVRTRKSLNLETSKRSISQQSSSVITNMPQALDSSRDDDHSTSDASTNHDNGRHYNIDGIADVLLALDRFEQDEELTYEQLLSLEANLFLGGLNLYDQHRDMRLDIDNMSYEELLVLEEKMGTVSTGLSEAELSKCIKTSIYEALQLENKKTMGSSCADDSKCSICQEEFVRGDEVGKMRCGHGYHTSCIKQWLGLKNWCPICKASPTPA